MSQRYTANRRCSLCLRDASECTERPRKLSGVVEIEPRGLVCASCARAVAVAWAASTREITAVPSREDAPEP
ncbi:MAG TPA: hypothetical protein VGI10_02165 [Polyangiaceae bacterium]